MFRNFFKVAFRNIIRHKSFSFINIAGLSLGLTACILIGLFVWDEHQYDKSIPDGEQVYRIYASYTTAGETGERAVAPPMIATTLKNEFPEVQQAARMMMTGENKVLIEQGENRIYEQKGGFVDSTFLEVVK